MQTHSQDHSSSAAPGAPLRLKPADFREQFIRMGWGVVDHYETGWKVVARWVDEEGRAALRADRKAYRQMQALQTRFAAIVEARSPFVATDFMAAMSRYANTVAQQVQALRA
jgi:hypothetical protein